MHEYLPTYTVTCTAMIGTLNSYFEEYGRCIKIGMTDFYKNDDGAWRATPIVPIDDPS